MTEIQQHRYDALVRRVGDLKGAGAKVSEILTELFPTIDVENVPGELLRLMSTFMGHGGGTITAAVAESATAQIFNPVGSGKLVTLSGVHFATDADGAVRWGVTNSARGTAISTQIFRDTRDLAPHLPIAIIRQESAVALASGTNQTRTLTDDDLFLTDANGVAILAPGTGFEIGTSRTNTTINYSFYWRERLAEPSELLI